MYLCLNSNYDVAAAGCVRVDLSAVLLESTSRYRYVPGTCRVSTRVVVQYRSSTCVDLVVCRGQTINEEEERRPGYP